MAKSSSSVLKPTASSSTRTISRLCWHRSWRAADPNLFPRKAPLRTTNHPEGKSLFRCFLFCKSVGTLVVHRNLCRSLVIVSFLCFRNEGKAKGKRNRPPLAHARFIVALSSLTPTFTEFECSCLCCLSQVQNRSGFSYHAEFSVGLPVCPASWLAEFLAGRNWKIGVERSPCVIARVFFRLVVHSDRIRSCPSSCHSLMPPLRLFRFHSNNRSTAPLSFLL